MAEPTEAEAVRRYMTRRQRRALQRGEPKKALVLEAIYNHCLAHPRIQHLAYQKSQNTLRRKEGWELNAHYRLVARQVKVACEQEQTSRLLDLPAELRVRILEFALPDERSIYIRGKKIRDAMRVLQVCRLMRTEGSDVFYALNRFMAPIEKNNSRTLADWLRLIEFHNAKRVRSLVLKFCPDPALVKRIEDKNHEGSKDALGDVFYSQDLLLQTLRQKLQHTGLRFESVSGYKFPKPDWEKKGGS